MPVDANKINTYIQFDLSLQGGPNWKDFAADSPIIVNAEADEFYKQPMFYALGHISRFMPEDSIRINITAESDILDLTFAAVQRPERSVAVTFLNK